MAARRSTDRLSGHDQDHAVAAWRQRPSPDDAGIAAGGLDQGIAGLDVAARLGMGDHGQRRPVADRPGGVVPSSLARMTLPRAAAPGIRCRRTSGVLPTVCSMVGWFVVMEPIITPARARVGRKSRAGAGARPPPFTPGNVKDGVTCLAFAAAPPLADWAAPAGAPPPAGVAARAHSARRRRRRPPSARRPATPCASSGDAARLGQIVQRFEGAGAFALLHDGRAVLGPIPLTDSSCCAVALLTSTAGPWPPLAPYPPPPTDAISIRP